MIDTMTDQTLRVTVPDEKWLAHLADFDDRVELSVWDFSAPQPDGQIDLAVSPYRNWTDDFAGIDPERLGGGSSAMQPRIDRVMRDQIGRLLNGDALASVVISPEGPKGTS